MSKKNYAGIIFYSVKITSLIFFLTACNGKIPHDIQKGLAGHWTLSGNTGDISGNGRDAIVLGDIDTMVKGPDGQAGSAILFNGLNSCLEIKSGRLFNPGKNDFSLSVWVKTGDDNDDVPGDIISQYDTSLHRGFHLSLKSNAVTTSQANALQVHFGIDSNHMSEWSDCGQLGNNTQTYSFAVYKGRLYVGTWPSGRVYSFGEINRGL
jgi:hypothetical protein